MALKDVKSTVTITTNAVKAIDDLDKLKKIVSELKQEIAKMKADGKAETDQFKDMNRALKDAEGRLKEMKRGWDLISDVMNNLATKTGKDLNRAIREVSKEFNKTGGDNKKYLDDLQNALAKIKDDQSIRRGLIMPLKEAEAQLKNLNNVSFDKLKQGLAAVEKEYDSLSRKQQQTARGVALRNAANAYRAQMAINQTGSTPYKPTAQMNAAQMQAERQRLMTAYNIVSQSNDQAHIQQADRYMKRIQDLNAGLKELANNERLTAEEAKKKQAVQEAARTVQDIYRGQKVSLEQLQAAYKTLQQRVVEYSGTNEAKANSARRQIDQVRGAMMQLGAVPMPNVQQSLKRIVGGNLGAATADQLKVVQQQLQQMLAQFDKMPGKAKSAEVVRRALANVDKQIKIVNGDLLTETELNKRLTNTGKYSVQQLQQAYNQLQMKLNSLHTNERTAIKATRMQMKALQREINRATGQVSGFAKAWQTAKQNIMLY